MEIFKKLDFDTSNQWIFYDERFHKFFDFFAENITDTNILSETQVLDHDEYVKRGEYLDAKVRKSRLQELEREFPGLMTHSINEINGLTNEYEIMEESYRDYNELVEDMRWVIKRDTTYENNFNIVFVLHCRMQRNKEPFEL